MWPYKGVVLICCLLCSINAQGPSIENLVKAQEECPDDRPYICVKYGKCCSGDQFCHAGVCESCFPAGLSEGELLAWCKDKGQHNVTLMRHGSCRLACHFKFKASAFSCVEENTPSHWMILFIVTIVLLVCLGVCAAIFICVKNKRRVRDRHRKKKQKVVYNSGRMTEDADLLNTSGETPPPVQKNLMRSLSNESNPTPTMVLITLPIRDNVFEIDDIQINENSDNSVTPTEEIPVQQ
ncbi:hypothetical protein Btru_035155 [Bulinus truncatus]|nr:hypothetical protein Btru_035155 [Bulinus truncatus]